MCCRILSFCFDDRFFFQFSYLLITYYYTRFLKKEAGDT